MAENENITGDYATWESLLKERIKNGRKQRKSLIYFGGITVKSVKEHVDELFKRIPESQVKEQIKQENRNLEEKVYGGDIIAQGK